MCAKHYENPTMRSRVTAKNVGDVFFETHCRTCIKAYTIYDYRSLETCDAFELHELLIDNKLIINICIKYILIICNINISIFNHGYYC